MSFGYCGRDVLDDLLERPELERQTRAIIDRLLAEKGITRYDIFDEIEEASEFLLGAIYPVSAIC